MAAWKELTANIEDIATAVSDANTAYACKLSQKHQATVKMFKGKTQVKTVACRSACIAPLTGFSCLHQAQLVGKGSDAKDLMQRPFTILCKAATFIHIAMVSHPMRICLAPCGVVLTRIRSVSTASYVCPLQKLQCHCNSASNPACCAWDSQQQHSTKETTSMCCPHALYQAPFTCMLHWHGDPKLYTHCG